MTDNKIFNGLQGIGMMRKQNYINKFNISLILFIFMVIISNLFIAQVLQAQQIKQSNYFVTEKVMLSKGRFIEKAQINGPPQPPHGFLRTTAFLPKPNTNMGINTLSDVPAFSWSFGCSATSAAMIAGYYDRNGYPNIYTGPTNGGVMPLDNDAYWSTWVDSYGDTRNRCPLSATQNGLDGRTERGHVDDYWIGYGNIDPDPFVTNGWTEHVHGDATGDFMGTSQSSEPMGNSDGGTTFWYYGNGEKLTAEELYSAGSDYYDTSGLCGLQEFYESRGYTVVEAFNQIIYPYGSNVNGFTFDDYKTEIDAGHPVMIHVEGHTMVGIGYDDNSNLIYIHDTWDHSVHTMTWGGAYAGMQQYGVTIVKLDATPIDSTVSGFLEPAVNGVTLLIQKGEVRKQGILSNGFFEFENIDPAKPFRLTIMGYPQQAASDLQQAASDLNVVGTWAFTYDWSCDGSSGTANIYFAENGTFSVQGYTGTWSLQGSALTFIFESGTTYAGTIEQDNQSMSGTMVDYNGYTGCWDAIFVGIGDQTQDAVDESGDIGRSDN